MTRTPTRRLLAGSLLLSASALAFAAPAMASDAIFASDHGIGEAAAAGERVTQLSGLTQIRLANGGIASFVDGASYQLRADGSIDLFSGSVTVAGGEGDVVVHLADRGEGRVSGKGSAASFSVDASEGGRSEARGHVLTGKVTIALPGGSPREFRAGQMWRTGGRGIELAVANGAAPVPEGDGSVQPMGNGEGSGGLVAAAENGVPVVLGDALAAAGASGDIVAAARRVQAAAGNPSLETFPSGDLALLVAYAGRLQGAYGGTPFTGAGADIIRTYLQFLSGGGAQASFLSAYAGFMVQYIDLIRSGALPSSFRGASLAQINSFIAFRGRTAGFGTLSGQNKVLIDAYLAFIQGGGNADLFVTRYTDLTNAYFAFLRGGGTPSGFAGASQATITAYLTFLRDAGLLAQLSAQNQALLSAYLQNLGAGGNGIGFADQYRLSLNAYYVYLQQGRLPSGYSAADLATLRQYLETLKATGLFEQVLGTQAGFYSGYLVWLQGGGSVDGYGQLPANIFAGYTTALNAYYEFLKNGGVPSGYSGLTQAQISAYIAALQAAGATGRYLGDLSTFWTDYFAWASGGNNPDIFAGLPTPPDFPAFASALNAYAAYLAGGGLPAGYNALTQDQLRQYINAIIAAGRLNELLGANATLLSGYFSWIAGGGTPNNYVGLPIYANYASALQAYYAYLAAGGLPGSYSALTPAQIQAYLAALINAGAYNTLITGEAGSWLSAYYTYLAGGGVPGNYSGLPVYASYVSALQAYYAYLAGGGLPSGYSALTLAQLQAYLQALINAGVFNTLFTGNLATFFQGYYAFVSGGGTPNSYTGLPANSGSGSGSGTGTPPPVLTGYSGGFNPSSPKVYFGVPTVTPSGLMPGGEYGLAATAYTLNSSGGLTGYTRVGGFQRSPGTTTISDIWGNANAVIGRWSNGTTASPNSVTFNLNANQSMQYLMTRPVGSGFAVPASGDATFSLIAATKPTMIDGSLAPGSFAATIKLLFGAAPKVAMEGSITMPKSGGDLQFAFATVGGLANPTQSTSVLTAASEGSLSWTVPAGDNTGTCTATSCTLGVYGSFAGDTNTIGILYTANRTDRTQSIQGAAIFGANVTGSGSGSGSGSALPAPTGDAVMMRAVGQTNQPGTSTRYAQGTFYSNATVGAVASADGQLQNATWSSTYMHRITASNVDYGTAGGVIGWSRWAGGTVAGTDNVAQEIPANGGMSHVWGTPVSNMPSSGTINYTVVGSTKPIVQAGTSAPGTLNNAHFTVAFPTLKAGFDANLTVGGQTYAIASTGGISAPSMTIASNGVFADFNAPGTHITGFLAGPGASHAGVSYNIYGPGVSGVVAFAKP